MDLAKILISQKDNSRLGHAYLVIGHFESEKIRNLLGVKIPDYLEINLETIKIGQIREIIHWSNLKPHSSPRRLIIIRNLENITLEAANALLKILEEPPKSLIFILQAQNSDKILPTITSRCQIVKINKKDSDLNNDDLTTFQSLAQKSLKERFDYASKIYESKNAKQSLDFWEQDLRKKLLQDKDVLAILKEISKARDLLSTNTSVKLLLENLFLMF